MRDIKRLYPVFAATLAVSLSGCMGFLADQKASEALTGTSWTLHAIRSSSTKLVEPGKFTLTLGPEGKATLRLDCNRGSAKWQASADSPTSGLLMFGPVAGTRALCPPPAMDDQVTMSLALVRGYTLSEGKLQMSLMSDGTVMEWQPFKE